MDNSTIESAEVLFLWRASYDNDPGDSISSYTIWLGNDTDFSGEFDSTTTSDTCFTISRLTDDMDYFWKVRAEDLNGGARWSNETFVFSVHVPEPPSAFDLISPADGDTLVSDSTTLCWHHAHDPDPGDNATYCLFLDTFVDLNRLLLQVDCSMETTATVNIGEMLYLTYWDSPIEVSWWVEAVSNDDTVESNSRWSFQIAPRKDITDALLSGIPTDYAIAAVYPNPFNDQVQIVIAVPEYNRIEIAITDVLGRSISILNRFPLRAGYHRFAWRPAHSSGIYFLHARCDNGWTDNRMLVYIK